MTTTAAAAASTQPGPHQLLEATGGEKLLFWRDEATGLRAVLAVHTTIDGRAAGGTRMKPYASELDAARDAARLARAMTYKYGGISMRIGGAKSVIIGDPARDKTPELLRRFGEFVHQQGEYWVGEDVGTNVGDMAEVGRGTDHLVAVPEDMGGPGDLSLSVAQGVLNAVRASCQHAYGAPSVEGRSVAVQGLGMVGMKLARLLVQQGAVVTVADIAAARVQAAVDELGVAVAEPDRIHALEVDVFAPCALGDAIHEQNVGEIRAKVVAGAANNAFASTDVADRLQDAGHVYAQDFIANAGALVYDDQVMQRPIPAQLDHERAHAFVDSIFDRTLETFRIAAEERVPYWRAALLLSEANIAAMSAASSDRRG